MPDVFVGSDSRTVCHCVVRLLYSLQATEAEKGEGAAVAGSGCGDDDDAPLDEHDGRALRRRVAGDPDRRRGRR